MAHCSTVLSQIVRFSRDMNFKLLQTRIMSVRSFVHFLAGRSLLPCLQLNCRIVAVCGMWLTTSASRGTSFTISGSRLLAGQLWRAVMKTAAYALRRAIQAFAWSLPIDGPTEQNLQT